MLSLWWADTNPLTACVVGGACLITLVLFGAVLYGDWQVQRTKREIMHNPRSGR